MANKTKHSAQLLLIYAELPPCRKAEFRKLLESGHLTIKVANEGNSSPWTSTKTFSLFFIHLSILFIYLFSS